MAAAYHASRDLFPHARTRRLRYQPGGEIFFRPDPERWRGLALQPRPSVLTRAGDPLDGLVAAAGARDLSVQAWTVFLHVDWTRGRRPALRRADLLRRPVPDRALPREPGRARVRAHARRRHRGPRRRLGAGGVAAPPRARARRAPRALFRRAGGGRAPAARAVLLHATASTARGVTAPTRPSCSAGPAPRSSGRSRATRRRRPPSCRARRPASSSGVSSARLLDARCETVATLAGELAGATAEHGARFELLDSSGAIKGYADGRPEGDPAPSIAWRHGVDVAACARAGATIGAIAYAADPARVAHDLDAYRDRAQRAGRDSRWSPRCAPCRPIATRRRTSPRSCASRAGGGCRPRRLLPLRHGAAERARPDPRGARAGGLGFRAPEGAARRARRCARRRRARARR